MDTVSLVSLLIAIGAGLVLALCAAIEASNIMLARRRLRGITAPGLVPLMRTYVRERQRLLRHLRAGVSVSTVTMTSALIVLFDGVEWTRVLLAAAVTVVLISSLRSASRIVTLSRPEGAAARLEARRALQLLLRPLSFLLSAPTAVPLRALGLEVPRKPSIPPRNS
ncbi:MAG: hypothetical protein H6674_09065 [Dehalococcoidia bacterium]|nr:hypothetical protein [Dehalococcoidia bacterium]